MELTAVPIERPDDLNVIVGQAHFIKTVEDLHEALAGASPHLRLGSPSAKRPVPASSGAQATTPS
jgi:adenosine/AMP kinase